MCLRPAKTEVQKLTQAQILQSFLGDRHINPLEARRRILTAAGFTDFGTLLLEEAPPDPELASQADEIEIKKRAVEIKAQKVEIDGMKAKVEMQKAEALVAEIRSKIILNLAKAEEAADKPQIESLSVLLRTVTEQGRQELEAGKAADAREANEQKAKSDERRV